MKCQMDRVEKRQTTRTRLWLGIAVYLAIELNIVPATELWSNAAVAQTDSDDAATTIVISGKDCRRFVRHTARSDVNYKPGVDVYGRPVKSA